MSSVECMGACRFALAIEVVLVMFPEVVVMEAVEPPPVVALATVGLILPVIAVLLFSPLATLIFLVWRASRAIDAEDAVVVDAPLPMLKFEGKVKCETRFCIT